MKTDLNEFHVYLSLRAITLMLRFKRECGYVCAFTLLILL